ncbi:unnamed protein product [Notodromas monacha]|uniref:Uncharacterized protein n=1 Tax=Notodromas monacha TaxID=399045 RepID=A0A7R9BR73_9CRUS|nr:unnamed protein product [Notodromas monacha]CAG0918673.1 unnamed protein product [Notodromas monacha]
MFPMAGVEDGFMDEIANASSFFGDACRRSRQSRSNDAYVPVLKLDGIELDLVFAKLPIAAQVRDNLVFIDALRTNLDDSFHVAPRPTRNDACEADGTGVVLPMKSSESFLTRTIFGSMSCTNMGKTGKAPERDRRKLRNLFSIPAMPKRTL